MTQPEALYKRNSPRFSIIKNMVVITLTFELIEIMPHKDSKSIVNSEDPDVTAPLEAV